MNILAIVAPAGAGKTHVLANTAKALTEGGYIPREKIRYIINDAVVEGVGGEGVDANVAEAYADVTPLTNGCFTCESPEDTRKALAQAEADGIELILFEGFGFVAGDETVTFIEETGYPHQIFGLYDYRNHETNQAFASAAYPSYACAPSGIFLTKTDGSTRAEIEEFFEFVMRCRTNSRTPITPLQKDKHIPVARITSKQYWLSPKNKKRNEHDHDHSHDHHHHGHEDHNHGHNVPFVSYLIMDGVQMDHVQTVVEENLGREAVRVKIAVDGILVDRDPSGNWGEPKPHNGRFITTYFKGSGQLLEENEAFADIIVPPGAIKDGRPSYARLRDETGIPTETTLRLIHKLLKKIPNEPAIRKAKDGYVRLLTHPEMPLQILKEICRRKSVVKKWHPRVMERCLEYWIKCAIYLHNNEEKVLPEQRAKNKMELAVSLAWWTNEFGDQYPKITTDTVASFPLIAWLAEGLAEITTLRVDEVLAPYDCIEPCRVVHFGKQHGKTEGLDRALSEIERLGELAKEYPEKISYEGLSELRDVYIAELTRLRAA